GDGVELKRKTVESPLQRRHQLVHPQAIGGDRRLTRQDRSRARPATSVRTRPTAGEWRQGVPVVEVHPSEPNRRDRRWREANHPPRPARRSTPSCSPTMTARFADSTIHGRTSSDIDPQDVHNAVSECDPAWYRRG